MSDLNNGDEIDLRRQFEILRKRLSSSGFAGIASYPLIHWVAGNDRRLPKSLLDISVGDICQKSFDELWNAPGIGRIKFGSLIRLLQRVARGGGSTPDKGLEEPAAPLPFDPDEVTEQDWQRYVIAVRRGELDSLPLGRLVASLRDIPSQLWDLPLTEITGTSLAGLKSRSGFGAKRVRAILEVLHHVHRLGLPGTDSHLRVRLLPRQVANLEDWLYVAQNNGSPPNSADVKKHLFERVFSQMECDLLPAHLDVIQRRLGFGRPQQSAQSIADQAKVTRARVHQQIRECVAAFQVRWPTGRFCLSCFANYLDGHKHDQCAMIRNLAGLLFSPTPD